MNLKLVAGAVIVAGTIVAGVLVLHGGRGGKPKHPRPAPGAEKDSHDALDTVQAMLDAPEGATPCESAWNAIEAEQAAAKAKRVASFFVKVAPRDEFLRLCNALPPASQPCMVPRYATLHRAECEAARPPEGALRGMFEARATKDPIEQENLGKLFGIDAGPP